MNEAVPQIPNTFVYIKHSFYDFGVPVAFLKGFIDFLTRHLLVGSRILTCNSIESCANLQYFGDGSLWKGGPGVLVFTNSSKALYINVCPSS